MSYHCAWSIRFPITQTRCAWLATFIDVVNECVGEDATAILDRLKAYPTLDSADTGIYDILSYEANGGERFIEVKTTKYGSETPFFVSRNEVATSERLAPQYQVYRLFSFRKAPRLYTLAGAIGSTCRLSAASFLALPK